MTVGKIVFFLPLNILESGTYIRKNLLQYETKDKIFSPQPFKPPIKLQSILNNKISKKPCLESTTLFHHRIIFLKKAW